MKSNIHKVKLVNGTKVSEASESMHVPEIR